MQTKINTLKNNEVTGEDKINAELWKTGGHELRIYIFRLIQNIWEEERLPEGRNESLICPIN